MQFSSQWQEPSIDIHRLKKNTGLSNFDNLHDLVLIDETNLHDDSVYFTTDNEYNGSNFATKIISICKRLEPNLSYAELMMFILNCSNNFSCGIFDDKNYDELMAKFSDFLQMQHIHVTILWKYFINQYGFIETVRHFKILIKTCTSHCSY
ncbi:unnamed protein product [Rotaria magnacalcarata]|uniref:Uncharacterized protein n=1 Tax=Rotaria magnacalcarata TaxID=392030 RepID=A0A820B886_9BILA|nr:unnamed protein product [Rotaria magnacalcarata]CAF1662189.1 unnamed protein product [Rotaria magnacalcarata]CAF2092320.1 unnamed protein product [Rotaria magnacalcarata]CAF2121453.1 unnamed protein product [Rotaria magnacalcarata]CAF3773056.1 unnamed protein product [Rotaria magnacalcarata]